MKIRGHGSAVAIALAGLAVVIAASGTAYAVTATTVNIADPTTPSRIAHVDQSGRLNTLGPSSTIAISTGIGFDTTAAWTSPTTASLAISTLSFSNPSLNSGFAGTHYQVSIIKITAGTAGNCTLGAAGVSTERVLTQFYLDPGNNIEQTYPAPLVVRPTGTAKYCIGAAYYHVGGGSQTSLYTSAAQLTGYVTSGSYSGLGAVGSAKAPVLQAPKLLTK